MPLLNYLLFCNYSMYFYFTHSVNLEVPTSSFSSFWGKLSKTNVRKTFLIIWRNYIPREKRCRRHLFEWGALSLKPTNNPKKRWFSGFPAKKIFWPTLRGQTPLSLKIGVKICKNGTFWSIFRGQGMSFIEIRAWAQKWHKKFSRMVYFGISS